MKTLNYYLKQAKEGKFAIPHFNFASAEQLKAVILGFKSIIEKYNLSPEKYCLMVGTSQGEAGFLGYNQARGLVDAWKKELSFNIFLNADHHRSFDSCKKAIDSGYDSVLMDGSKMSFEENLKITKQVVQYAKSKNDNIIVEGELGYMPGESKVQEEIEVKPELFTKPDQAKEFVEKTGVNSLAVVFGNIHGIVTKQKPKLDLDLLAKINNKIPETFLVLHGGSGLTNDDFVNSIDNGIVNIHINTEVRVAYRKGLEEEFRQDPNQTTPYKFLQKAVDEMKKVVEGKTTVFLRVQ